MNKMGDKTLGNGAGWVRGYEVGEGAFVYDNQRRGGNYYVQDLEKNRKITEWTGYKKERDQAKKANTNKEGPRLANNTAWKGHNPTSPWNINPAYSYFGYNLF